MPSIHSHLVFHGAVVLITGLLCGAPFGRAINRDAPAQVINGWRVAHGSLVLVSILLIALGAVLPSLTVAASVKSWIAGLFIVSTYAFCVSLPLGAIVGHRGLSPAGSMWGKVVYAGNVAGAAMSLLAALLLAWAAFRTL